MRLFPAGIAGLCVAGTMILHLLAQDAAAPADEDTTNRIFVGPSDGSARKLLTDMPDYTAQGSPCWSADGKLIAFDAWRPKLGETNTDSKIILVNADGSDPRVLGDGAMPSFSPKAKRIAFSRYEPNHGVWVMSVEGPEKELVQLDETGWSAKWSPDGTRIVYTVFEEGGANFAIFDLVEGERTLIFEEGKSPYASLFWNFAWSPDSRRIAFKGQRKDSEKQELGIVDARGAQHGLTTRLENKQVNNVAWTHDGKRLFFSQQSAERKNRFQIFVLAADTMDPPELFPGQDPNRGNSAAVESTDGKQLLIVSRKPPMNNAGKKKKAE